MRWQGGFPPAPVSTNASAGQRAAPTRRVHRIEGPGQAVPDNFQIGLIFFQNKQFQIIDPLAVAGESSLRRSVSRTAAEGRISATRIPFERRDAQRRGRLLLLNPPSQSSISILHLNPPPQSSFAILHLNLPPQSSLSILHLNQEGPAPAEHKRLLLLVVGCLCVCVRACARACVHKRVCGGA